MESSCELVLLIADCSYVTLYCKDPVMLKKPFISRLYNAGFTALTMLQMRMTRERDCLSGEGAFFYEAPDRA